MGKSKEPTSRIAGRDARDGRFIPIKETYRDPDHTVRERLPLPGHGENAKNR